MRYWIEIWCKTILVALVWGLVLLGSQASANPVEKHILILNGFSPEFTAVEAFNGSRTVLLHILMSILI